MVNLHVDTWGTGPTPALLLHGFATAGTEWRVMEPHCSTAFRVRAPDLPGHGQSGVEAGGFHDVVESLARVAERDSVVVGYSQGARLALALAIHFPDLVRALVLESGTAGMETDHARMRRADDDERRARQVETLGLHAFVEQWEAQPLFADQPIHVRNRLRPIRLSNTPAGLAWAMRALGQGASPPMWHQLNAVKCPVLVVTGARDAAYTQTGARMVQVARGTWKHVTLPANHAVHAELPAEFARSVIEFVETHQPDGGRHEEEVRVDQGA